MNGRVNGVYLINGSRKPPLKVTNLIKRVCEREGVRVPRLRYIRKRGGGTYYGWPHPTIHIRTAEMGWPYEQFVILHELAHHIADPHGHGPMFYRALARIAKAEGCYRSVLAQQGSRMKAEMRRQRAA